MQEIKEMDNVMFDVNKLGEAADGSMQEVIPKLWIGNLQAVTFYFVLLAGSSRKT